MKSICLVLLICVSIITKAAEPSLNEVRMLFQIAAKKQEACTKLISLLKPYNHKNHPLYTGYKGCATMLMAKYVFNPFTKFSNFNNGKGLLESAIAADKANVELRFLRFAVQTKTPSFLGYKNAINTDKNILISSITHMRDIQLKEQIISFLKNSDYVSVSEKQRLI